MNADFTTEEFPLYAHQGEISKTGNIVCSSCHDPHQWSSDLQAKGEGIKTEGNIKNGFLRPNLLKKYCASCHGKNALIMFQYFHKKLGRIKNN